MSRVTELLDAHRLYAAAAAWLRATEMSPHWERSVGARTASGAVEARRAEALAAGVDLDAASERGLSAVEAGLADVSGRIQQELDVLREWQATDRTPLADILDGSGYTPATRAAIVQRECAALEERMAERAADIARLTMTVPAK